LAEPPAESPSTRKISLSEGSEIWQSDNFPGRVESIKDPLFLARSLARFAASLALAASTDFAIIFLDLFVFSYKNILSF